MPKLDLTSLEKALQSLDRSLAITCSQKRMSAMDDDLTETVRAGVIQNFEVAYELCWKFMKRWLEENLGKTNVDGVPRYELYRMGFENKLIESADDWFEFHRLRNETSHTYDVAAAEDVFHIASQFYTAALALFKKLESLND